MLFQSVSVSVSPHHSTVEGTSAGTVSSRSHSCMTDSPPPTLIQPGSHTHTHTRNIHIYTPDAVIGLMPQQPITLHAHWHECRFDESATGAISSANPPKLLWI